MSLVLCVASTEMQAKRQCANGFRPTFRRNMGVTSGYIIPDVVAVEYKLYHFDLLIYDQLNSPMLWSDGDYDQSEQGKRRAIPAKHIHAAFEIKASLTSKTARDAIAKLSDFNRL